MFRQALVVFIVVFTLSIGGIWGFKLYQQKTQAFKWGVFIKAYSFNSSSTPESLEYRKENTRLMMEQAKRLGVTHIKANAEREQQVNDDLVDLAQEMDLKLVMILDREQCPGIDLRTFFKDPAVYQKGLNWGRTVSSRYKGKVAYYQLANEISGTIVMHEGEEGASFANKIGNARFSLTKYNQLSAWIRGLRDGIKQNDPRAKIVISGHWVLVSVIDKLLEDGIDFDVLGWNWYYGDGSIVEKEIDGEMIDFIGILQAYGKEVWIAEANRPGGDYDGDSQAQAEAIKKMALEAYNTGVIKGFFVFVLNDYAYATPEPSELDTMGLIRVKPPTATNPVWTLGDHKPAYGVYQQIIASYR
jgi:hypothetical protein